MGTVTKGRAITGAAQGGARPGAGRPKKFENQLKDAQKLIKELENLTKEGIRRAALALPELVGEELETAMGPKADADPKLRMAARHFLINMVMERVRVHDVEDSPVGGFFEKWAKGTTMTNVEGDVHIHAPDVAAESPGRIIEVESSPIP